MTLLDVGSNEGTFVDAMMMDLQQRAIGTLQIACVQSPWEPQPRFLPQLGKLAERWQGSVVDAQCIAGTRGSSFMVRVVEVPRRATIRRAPLWWPHRVRSTRRIQSRRLRGTISAPTEVTSAPRISPAS